MRYRYNKGGEIKGQLEVLISHNEDQYNGAVEVWEEVLIHGDSKGLKSFAKLLIEIAELIKKMWMINIYQLEQENIII